MRVAAHGKSGVGLLAANLRAKLGEARAQDMLPGKWVICSLKLHTTNVFSQTWGQQSYLGTHCLRPVEFSNLPLCETECDDKEFYFMQYQPCTASSLMIKVQNVMGTYSDLLS